MLHRRRARELVRIVELLGLSSVGDVVSAVENVSAAYSDTTVAPLSEDRREHAWDRVSKFEHEPLSNRKPYPLTLAGERHTFPKERPSSEKLTGQFTLRGGHQSPP
jgi:hypothetical protein